MNFIGHFKTITEHKLTVMRECFKVGLYKQGLCHDLSKYAPIEFLTGARYYQGTRSPNAVEKETLGYSPAWLHHKGRNRHHFEYWMDWDVDPAKGVVVAKMPLNYAVEMFLDRVAASKIYQKEKYTDKSPWIYYSNREKHYYNIMHPDTRKLLEKLLKMLAVWGEDKTFAYIRTQLLPRKTY